MNAENLLKSLQDDSVISPMGCGTSKTKSANTGCC